MDLREHFLADYERYRQRVEGSVGLLTEEEFRQLPRQYSSSVIAPAYLWWETARLEDRSVAALDGRSQVITDPGWLLRIGVTQSEADQAGTIPYAPTDEKNHLGLRINREGLRAYWDAVGIRTRDIMAGLPLEMFDKLVSSGPTVCADTGRTFWTCRYLSGRVSHVTALKTPARDLLSRLSGQWSESSQVFGVIVGLRDFQG